MNYLQIVVSCIIIFLIVGGNCKANWSQIHYDELHSGQAKDQIEVHKLKWISTLKTGNSTSAISSTPIVHDGVIFVTNGKHLYALDQNDGEKKWNFTRNSTFTGSCSARNEILIINSWNGFTYGIDVDGNEIWNRSTGIGMPTINENLVFTGGGNSIFCLNLENGEVIWESIINRDPNTISVANGSIYFGTNDGTALYSMSKENGTINWIIPTEDTYIVGAPAIFKNYIIAATWREEGDSYSGHLYCIDINGTIIWTNSISQIPTKPVVSDDKVIIGTWDMRNPRRHDSYVNAYNVFNGDLVWQANYRCRTAPAISKTSLYFPDFDSKIISLNISDGETVWNSYNELGTIPVQSDSSPSISNGELYIGGVRSKVIAIGRASGNSSNDDNSLERVNIIFLISLIVSFIIFLCFRVRKKQSFIN